MPLTSSCCCGNDPPVIPGECCNTTWFQNQPDSLSFSSGTMTLSSVYWQYLVCTPSGPGGGPIVFNRVGQSTSRHKISFSNVELEKGVKDWGFYNGTISNIQQTSLKAYSTFPIPDDCAYSPLTCSYTYTIASSVTAVNGVYTTTSAISCSSSGSAYTSWPQEPSGIADDWFQLKGSACGGNGFRCQSDGSVVEMENIQFEIRPPFFWPQAQGCPGCSGSYEATVPQGRAVANNPDCDTTDITDLDWYTYNESTGGAGQGGQWCTNPNSCVNCDCGFFKDTDVYSTATAPPRGNSNGSCSRFGLIIPEPTLTAI